jgi:pectate lyase
MQSIFEIFRRILPLILLFTMVNMAAQQENELNQKHMLGANFGFTFVPMGSRTGTSDARGVFTKTVGIDYFYHFHPRWGAGFMGAYEIDHYVVTDDQVEVENAVILTLVGMYSATRHLDFFLGGGIVVEQNDNLAVLRLGTQYSIDVGKHWALVPKLHFDFKENYNTWSFAVSFARRL